MQPAPCADGERVSIAGVNGPLSTVVSGERGGGRVARGGLEGARAQDRRACGSATPSTRHLMEPMLEEFERVVQRARLHAAAHPDRLQRHRRDRRRGARPSPTTGSATCALRCASPTASPLSSAPGSRASSSSVPTPFSPPWRAVAEPGGRRATVLPLRRCAPAAPKRRHSSFLAAAHAHGVDGRLGQRSSRAPVAARRRFPPTPSSGSGTGSSSTRESATSI